ncbi:MAG: fumarylacetoacetate hydrolase [Dehalococcoidia bacterium]|nr:fumarylacetoacetate hydrolase [Dehalococcoidia bacterium]MQG16368.1 fumarylacetoacetate hydrolase family protein [SAR202 cluster bacterium]
MKFARYELDGAVHYGIVSGDTVNRITGNPWEKYEVAKESESISSIKILAPTAPSKIIAIGLNYKSHLGDKTAPSVPEPFIKTPSCIVGPNDCIVLPTDSTIVQEEAELAIIFGKTCRNATKQNALDYVFGYTCANDVSERDWQKNDLQWTRAKSSDTFGPIGPFIVTGLDPSNLAISARLNGQTVQSSNTSDLLFDVPSIIEWVSKFITMEPGDLILTGTPGTTATLNDGDTIEIEVEGIGVLSNCVKAE